MSESINEHIPKVKILKLICIVLINIYTGVPIFVQAQKDHRTTVKPIQIEGKGSRESI